MNQMVGCYLALNSGFGGCQIVLIHVLGGCQIVLIRLLLGVSAGYRLLTLTAVRPDSIALVACLAGHRGQ